MAEESKKISFSFSKSIKKPALKNVPLPEEKKVDYIECIEDKTIKIVGGEEKEDEPLVIPMLGTKTWHDRIINKTDADIFEPKKLNPVKDEPLQDVQIKQEQLDGSLDSRNTNGIQPSNEVVIIKEEPIEEKHMTLDEQAAKEIIADLQSNKGQNTEQKVFSVPVAEEDLRGKEESTLEDYENIPIDQFGMAMLRGMGWQPGKGIGKNQKIVPPVLPELRPKGMGLGADKLISQKTQSKTVKQEEQLKLIQGAYVKVVAGKHDGKYGQIEGFDEDAARLIVKLAIGGNSINVNEVWVEPVTSSEYSQKSKVLNARKFEEFKKTGKVQNDDPPGHQLNEDPFVKSKNGHPTGKSKKEEYESSDGGSDYKKKSKKRKNSSDSGDEDRERKRSKKSKKHRNRDSSSERSSKKNKKKDKERERMKHRKSGYSDSSERIRKKSRRSRSRSRSPKSRRRERSRSYSPRR